MSRARVAVIGCGWWSTFAHLPALAERPDAEIVALVDPDPARRRAAAGAFGSPPVHESVEDLLASVEVDGAVIAAPHSLHYPLATQTLSQGVHTLLEKPMVLDPAHARELMVLADENDVELLVDYPWHYNPHVLELRREIAAGRIGRVEHVSCLYASTVRELYRGKVEPYRDAFGYPVNAPGASTYSDPAVSGGGQGQTQVTHAAALVQWLTQLRPRRVAAFTANFELDVDLADSVAVEYASGALGTFSSTGAVQPDFEETVRVDIVGDAGHIHLDVNQGSATIHSGAAVESLAVLPLAERNPVAAPVHNLVDLIQGRSDNGSPAEVGAGAVDLVAAMYASARTGAAVEVYDESRRDSVIQSEGDFAC